MTMSKIIVICRLWSDFSKPKVTILVVGLVSRKVILAFGDSLLKSSIVTMGVEFEV